MRDRVVAWLGLQDITDYSEVGLVEDMLYRGVIDLLTRTRCVVRCVQLHTVAGQDTYTLDHLILALVDLENGTRPRARRDQTDQTAYNPGFTLIRADVLRLSPTPTDDTGTVQVWAVLRPTKMTQDTDDFGSEAFGAIPEEYQDAIELYALWKAADYTDDGGSQMGERYRALYEGPQGSGGRLSEIRGLVNKRGTAKPPRARVMLPGLAQSDYWTG
jgi:hypothetical protein